MIELSADAYLFDFQKLNQKQNYFQKYWTKFTDNGIVLINYILNINFEIF